MGAFRCYLCKLSDLLQALNEAQLVIDRGRNGTSGEMLSAASLSGLSNSLISSGFSESVDLDLVDEIIERSPRGATAFPLVYKAYVSTLQDNGISPANDTAYYQFLLKLQVIRAATWGEKWDLWRATHLTVSPAAATSSPKLPKTARLADVRARVPFLAGASSDLDDAFGEGETSYSADAESIAESETPMRVLRPSPRKFTPSSRGQTCEPDQSRSLVGYTPDQSVDLSSLGLDFRPARASTPLAANQRKSHRYETTIAATPPPYSVSVSDIGVPVSEPFDLIEEDGMLIRGLSTPKASARQLEEERILEEEVLMELERRADQFYETGLMGRCFDVWAQSNDWIQKTTQQIDTVRANILLRQHLLKWRAEKDRVLSLPNTADQHRRQHLQLSALSTWVRRYRDKDLAKREMTFADEGARVAQERAWGKWRAELTRRRTDRWEKDMKAREKRFVRAKETVLVQDVLDRWRGETRTRIDTRLAVSVDRDRLLRHTFSDWHYRLEQKERLEGQLAVFQRTSDKKLSGAMWDKWVQGISLRRAEAVWTSRANERTKREIFGLWRVSVSQASQADAFYRRFTLSDSLQKWKKARVNVRSLERKAVLFRKAGDQAILRQALTRWTVMERGVLLVRVMDQRLLKGAWDGWRDRLQAVQALDDRLVPLQQNKNGDVLNSSLQTWRTALSARRTQLTQAAEVYDTHRLSVTLGQWRKAAAKIKADREVAEKARAFFVLRQVFGVWKAQKEARKQERWAEARRLELVRKIFTQWRDETRRSIEGKAKADQFRRTSDQRLIGNTLSNWTTRVIFLKSRQLDVSENRDARLLSSALSRWIQTRRKIADSQALADSFVIVKGEETLRDVMEIWRDRAVRKRERREAGILAQKRLREKLLRGAWDIWRDKAMERRLEEIEEEVAIRHEDAILFRVWDKWKAKATILPAITFDNHRVKQKAWTSLIRAMDRARAMKEFGGPRDRRLLEDVLAVWRRRTQTKVIARAGRLRGRLRPSQIDTSPHPTRIHSLPSPKLPAYTDPAPSYLPSAQHARRPTHTQQPPAPRHIRSASTSHSRYLPTEPQSLYSEEDEQVALSVYSEPAYSRLRSELAKPRSQRGGSEEVHEPAVAGVGRRGRSELINALKGGLGR